MSDWIDITRPLDDTLLCWPGRTPPVIHWEKRMADGEPCNVSSWAINAHTGTHIDAPRHFIDDGKTIDQIAPEVLIGACTVLDAQSTPRRPPLGVAELEAFRGAARLLIGTGHADRNAGHGYPGHGALLTPDGARALLDAGLRLIGTDRLSVDATDGQDFPIHEILLGAGCVIVEGLDLATVSPGAYTLCVLPLRIVGAEASPARALLAPPQAN